MPRGTRRGGLEETGGQEHVRKTPDTNSVFGKCDWPCASGGSEHRGVVRNKAQHLARGQFAVNFFNSTGYIPSSEVHTESINKYLSKIQNIANCHKSETMEDTTRKS